jgi:type III pantothenate kinase
MDLLLDVGNTRLKWGLHDGDRLARSGRGAAVGARWLCRRAGGAGAGAAHARRQRGRRHGRRAARRDAGRRGLEAEWIRPQAEGFGVRNAYLDPARLGADRWAALVGARALHGGRRWW